MRFTLIPDEVALAPVEYQRVEFACRTPKSLLHFLKKFNKQNHANVIKYKEIFKEIEIN
jgi:hypothetical protein